MAASVVDVKSGFTVDTSRVANGGNGVKILSYATDKGCRTQSICGSAQYIWDMKTMAKTWENIDFEVTSQHNCCRVVIETIKAGDPIKFAIDQTDVYVIRIDSVPANSVSTELEQAKSQRTTTVITAADCDKHTITLPLVYNKTKLVAFLQRGTIKPIWARSSDRQSYLNVETALFDAPTSKLAWFSKKDAAILLEHCHSIQNVWSEFVNYVTTVTPKQWIVVQSDVHVVDVIFRNQLQSWLNFESLCALMRIACGTTLEEMDPFHLAGMFPTVKSVQQLVKAILNLDPTIVPTHLFVNAKCLAKLNITTLRCTHQSEIDQKMPNSCEIATSCNATLAHVAANAFTIAHLAGLYGLLKWSSEESKLFENGIIEILTKVWQRIPWAPALLCNHHINMAHFLEKVRPRRDIKRYGTNAPNDYQAMWKLVQHCMKIPPLGGQKIRELHFDVYDMYWQVSYAEKQSGRLAFYCFCECLKPR